MRSRSHLFADTRGCCQCPLSGTGCNKNRHW